MSKQPLLMTGATGLVGSRFVEMFSDKYKVANMDLTTNVDITNKDSIAKFILANPSPVLIHLAAFTNTTEAAKQAGDKEGICYQVNVEGTKNIAEVCKEQDVHLIHVSTDFVFDGKNPPEEGYVEDSPRSPIEWYGVTKALAEEVVEKSGVQYTIMRISYPYRAHFETKPDLIMKIRQGLEANNLPPQFTDTLITPTFTDDIAQAFNIIIALKPAGILHVTGTGSLSPYELAKKVAVAYNLDPSLVKEGSLIEYLKTNPRPFARNAVMNNQKATTILGLHFTSIDEGLSKLKKQQI